MSAIGYTYNVAPNPTDVTGGLPVGTIIMYGAVTPPTGWLVCNGNAVSRTTYSALFNVVGTTFGTGDGSSTFNLPDTTNRTIRGGGAGSIGNKAGSDSVTLAIGNLPPHSHGVQANNLNFTGGGSVSSLQPNPSAPGNYVDGAILTPNTNTVVTAVGGTPTAVNVANQYVVIPSIIKYA